jgi:2'-5' RNA ligase
VSLPERVRTFVAVELDAAIRRRLAGIQRDVLRGFRGLRPTSEGGLHLTLKFLGEIPRGDVARAMRLVEAAAVPEEPFASEVGGLGAFPPRGRPRVVWVGMSDPEGTLARLHGRLDRSLGELGVRGRTVGTRRTSRWPASAIARARFGLADRLEEIPSRPAGVQEISEIVLMMSELRPSGALYTPLGRAALGGAVGGDG